MAPLWINSTTPPVIVPGVNLRADLRDPLMFLRQVSDDSRLGNGASERFFAIDMPPALEAGHRRHGMGGSGVPITMASMPFLVDQLAEVVVSLGLRVFLGGGGQAFFVHVAEGDDILAADFLEVIATASGDTDDADVELVVRRGCLRLGIDLNARQPQAGAAEGALRDEFSAGDACFHGHLYITWFGKASGFRFL